MADSAYFVKSTPHRVFGISFINFVTDILKMSMWKFDDEKRIFDKFTQFYT